MKKPMLCILMLSVTLAMPVPALPGGQPEEVPTEGGAQGEVLTICTEPRPEICTMDYRPVCAQHEDGTLKTYSNGCTACSDPAVIGHREGACE